MKPCAMTVCRSHRAKMMRRQMYGLLAVAALVGVHCPWHSPGPRLRTLICAGSSQASATGAAKVADQYGRRTFGVASASALLLFSASPSGAEENLQIAAAVDDVEKATRPPRTKVADEFNTLTPEMRTNVDLILTRLENDTGVKVRVLCTPPGILGSKEKWYPFFLPIMKEWKMDQRGAVIVVEERIADAALRMEELKKDPVASMAVMATVVGGVPQQKASEDRQPSLITIMPGANFVDKYGGALSLGYLYDLEKTFGTASYVDGRGTGAAVEAVVKNMAAVLYSMESAKSAKLLSRVKVVESAMGAEKVAAILARHPVQ